MNNYTNIIKNKIEKIRQEIIVHKVYPSINNIEQLKIFMRYHVYAVWDFMSLLKSLQNNLTCTEVPWFPKGDADTRFLINEIVVGEESDLDPQGNRKSHFELYIDAMTQIGADTQEILTFIKALRNGNTLDEAFHAAGTPNAARAFVRHTFEIIERKGPHIMAAVFTFGREDLIPGMFLNLVDDMHKVFPNNISIFKYYLERHIEVDGDHHSHLAIKMTDILCGQNQQNWEDCADACYKSLEKRKALWDGIYDDIILFSNT